jgi:hypothetical protein
VILAEDLRMMTLPVLNSGAELDTLIDRAAEPPYLPQQKEGE